MDHKNEVTDIRYVGDWHVLLTLVYICIVETTHHLNMVYVSLSVCLFCGNRHHMTLEFVCVDVTRPDPTLVYVYMYIEVTRHDLTLVYVHVEVTWPWCMSVLRQPDITWP